MIKALYDYEPPPGNTQELAFSKGDFFHVISREDDPDWYEACNPLIPNARGLVPVSFFEVIGKNERDSGGSVDVHKHHHDSGFSDRTDSTNTAKQGARSRMSSVGKAAHMVYGIVQYDFHAERPDELEAKAGEAIIVIAQSNPEWFVAKPIGRLGGPGLIPVSFVEIRDMTTNQPVADPLEAVRRAGVPKVEEWKKMTAEYKNSSITLGKIESAGSGVQSVTSGMERMSLSQHHGGHGYAHHNRNDHVSSKASFSHSLRPVELIRFLIRDITILSRQPGIKASRFIASPPSNYLRQCGPAFPDTVSITTSTGTSSRLRWRMAAGGSCPDIIMTSMTSKSRC